MFWGQNQETRVGEYSTCYEELYYLLIYYLLIHKKYCIIVEVEKGNKKTLLVLTRSLQYMDLIFTYQILATPKGFNGI